MIVVLAFVFLALRTEPAVAQNALGFAGTWERNPESSDDAQEKMQAAFEQMREQRGGRDAGMPPGGARLPGERGGMRGERRGGGPQRMANIPDELIVELEENELHVDDGERIRIYYLDGEKHKREMPNGMKLETVAERRGNAILIEEKMERGKIDHKYELAPQGGVMIWTVTMKMDGMKDPVVIKTVYDRIES